MYNNTPLWIQQLNWDKGYELDELINNKTLNIDAYLIHSISKDTNDFKFSIHGLSKRFHCNKATVYHAIKVLKGDRAIIIRHNHIHLNGYHPHSKKEGRNND